MPTPHHGFLLVRFRAGLGAAGKRAVASACHLDAYHPRHDLPGESYALVPVAPGEGTARARHAKAARALDRHEKVVRVGTVRRRRSTLVFPTDRLWVGLEPGAAGRAVLAALRRRGIRVLRRHDQDVLVRLPANADAAREARRIGKLRGVDYAEPDHVVVGPALGMGRPVAQPAFRAIGAPDAWRSQRIGAGIRVAILDCGVDAGHPALKRVVVGSHDTTGCGSAVRPTPWNSHGTECAGLVAATGARRLPRGVAAGAGLLSVRIGFAPERLDSWIYRASWVVAGIDWAREHGADVISMSVGGLPPSTPVRRAVTRARTLGRGGKGAVVVAAVGNDGARGIEFPASAAGVVGVAACDTHGKACSFSNWGAGVDIAAPGLNVKTITIPDPEMDNPGYGLTDSGTSLSTPIVAGVAALVIAADPALREKEVVALLTGTATGRHSTRLGAGMVNAAAAVRAAHQGAAARLA